MTELMWQSALNSVNWQMIVALAAGGVLAHKAVKNVNKAMLGLACLALAGWWFWPQNKVQTPKPPVVGDDGLVPPQPPYHLPRFVTPNPRSGARPGRPAPEKPPTTSREKRAWAIEELERKREAKVRNDPSYLDPKAREERIKAALAKEAERKRKAAQEEEARRLAQAKPAPDSFPMTPEQAFELELRMHRRQREQALADLQTVRQQYQKKVPEQSTLIGGLDYERPWR